MSETVLPRIKKIKKTYNHLGFRTFDLIGILLLSMFLAYSIKYLYKDAYLIITTYFPSFQSIKLIDQVLTDYYIKDYLLSNFSLLTAILFALQVVFFQNNKWCLKNNKVVDFLDQTFQKMSLLIPLKQFATFMFVTHANQINVPEEKLISDFSILILLSSFILSTLLISLVPKSIKTILKWKRNSLFALNSGLIFHYNNIQDLDIDYEFIKLLDSLGELKTIKFIGVTGKNTFVSSDSYLNYIFKSNQLKKSNKPTFKILLSKEDSEGLKNRGKSINTPIHILNNELEETKKFIDEHQVLAKYANLKYYTADPKFKMIFLEGYSLKIVLLQAYLDRNNILDEQVYIYEDKEGTSVYKILNEMYDDLYRSIK